MQLNLYAKVENKSLKINNRESLEQWIKSLNEGDDIVIKLNVEKHYKTSRQIRLIYSCFRKLSKHLGYSVEEIKTLMKFKFGICATTTIEGEDVTICKSLSDFSKKELTEFIEFVDNYSCQQLNYPLLNNNDKSFLKNEI